MRRLSSLRRLSVLLTLALLAVSVAQASPPPAPPAGDPCTTEVNTDRPGQDYTSKILSTANPNLCRLECEKNPKCKAYTYAKPGAQGPNARCWLKNGVPPAQPDTHYVAGVKLSGPPPPPAGENQPDCIAFDPAVLRVQEAGGRWMIVQGDNWLFDLGARRATAQHAYDIIQKNGFSQACFIGRPESSFMYFVSNPVPPPPAPTDTPAPQPPPTDTPAPQLPPTDTPVPLPPPTDTPVPLPPAVMVNIWAEPATVKAGECTTIKAQVSGVTGAWLDDVPIVNNYAEKQDCPCADSRHVLAYTLAPSEPSMHPWRDFTVHVTGSCFSIKKPVFPLQIVTPTPTPFHLIMPPFKKP